MVDRPVVIVTGGAKRVGRAICLTLARAGYDLELTFNSSGADAENVVRELKELGCTARAHHLDLGDMAMTEAWANGVATGISRLDGLVHNAAVYHSTPLSELTAVGIRRLYEVNAAAPLLISAILADRLIDACGAVVALTDVHTEGLPRAHHSAYAMSKAALAEMVRSLARDLAPEVRVNAIAPGVVAWPEQGPEAAAAVQRAYLRRVPLARSGTVEEAADAVLWLLRDAQYITGQVIRLDGGRSLV